jgi:GWxTD domain-containing protein
VRNRPRARLAPSLLLLPAWLWLGCGAPAPPSETGFLKSWTAGPACWLILPEEQRQLARVRNHAEAVAFIETFWRRRDPDGPRPGNLFEQEFHRRVEAADRLYGEGARRGSLTDRGRALVLLGSPPLLGYGQRPVPSWQPGPLGGKPAVETQHIPIERWTYPSAELPPRLRELLERHGREGTVVLTFAAEPHRTYLTDGERFLEMAARAAVVDENPF